MRKIYIIRFTALLFIFWGSIQLLHAQYFLTGMVRDSATTVGVPNKTVVITQKNSTYSKTVITDNSGIFYDTLNLSYGVHKKFYASTTDCNGNTVSDSVISYTPGLLMLDICTSNTPLCQAGFIFYQNGNNFKKVHFLNTSSLTADIYQWYFGDGDSSNAKNPVHFYPTAGAFTVCLTVTDTDINCSSTYCDTLYIFPSTACSNNFTYTTSNLNVNFQGSTNTTYPTVYLWNFGDGSKQDTGQFISHTYTHGGNYQVCLTTTSVNPWTYDTCIAHSCQTVKISGPPLVNISGQIFRDSLSLDTGRVYLYEFNSNTYKYRLKDSTEVIYVDSLDISYYYFDYIPIGKYMTKVTLLPVSTYYTQYAPAYYGNSIHWNATPAFDLQTQGYDYPINVSAIKPWTGLASIEGRVMEGSAKAPGDPVANVPIFLVDDNGFLLGYTHSDAAGHYSFRDLPYNKYYLYADLINFEIYPSTTTPSEADRFKSNIDIYIGKNTVTGITESTEIIDVAKLYPNPANNTANLKLNLSEEHIFSIELIDLLGNKIMDITRNEYFPPGNKSIRFDTGQLPNGFYTIVVKENNVNIKQLKMAVVH